MGTSRSAEAPATLRRDDRTAHFAFYSATNDEYRLPLTVLIILGPLGLLAELYRFMSEGLAGPEPLFEEQWRQLGALVGIQWPLVPVLLLTVGCLGVHLARRHPFELPTLGVVLRVLVWAALWMLVRYVVGFTTHTMMRQGLAVQADESQLKPLGMLGLAMSAALQEELVFRGLLLGLLALVVRGLSLGRTWDYLVALPLSAALFSLAHTEVFHAGAEPFTTAAFVHRFVAGMLYGLVFLRQGLAVAALAHFGYNVLIIFRLGPWLG